MEESSRSSLHVPDRDTSILTRGPTAPDPQEMAKAQEDQEKKISKLRRSLSNWRIGVTLLGALCFLGGIVAMIVIIHQAKSELKKQREEILDLTKTEVEKTANMTLTDLKKQRKEILDFTKNELEKRANMTLKETQKELAVRIQGESVEIESLKEELQQMNNTIQILLMNSTSFRASIDDIKEDQKESNRME